MPGIGVAFNPHSGRNRRDPGALDRLARRLGDSGVVCEVASPEALRGAAQEFRRLGVDVVAIAGGDGTNSMTLTGLLEAYAGAPLPRIALLRGGTMNTVANAVGVPRGRPDAALARLRADCDRGADTLRCVDRNLLRVRELEPRSGPGASRVGFLFGAGVICGFLAEYYAAGAAGRLDALTTLLRGVASAAVGGALSRRIGEPFRGCVEPEAGVSWPQRAFLAVAGGTIDQIGLGFRPFPRCVEAAGAFQLLGIHASALRLVRELPRIRCGVAPSRDCAEHALTPRAVLHPESGALRYMVDGDLIAGCGALEVAIGPRIRIVLPRAASREG